MSELLAQIKRARGSATPIVAINTSDQSGLEDKIATAFEDTPVMAWDVVRGPYPVTVAGEGALRRLLGSMDASAVNTFPDLSLMVLEADWTGLTDPRGMGPILLVHNAHRLVEDTNTSAAGRCIQGIVNLRDPFARCGSTLVLLAPSWTSPPELGSDVLELDDPLPEDEERRQMARQIFEETAQNMDEEPDGFSFTGGDVERSVNLTRGLSRFAAAQTVYLALRKKGIDTKRLQSRFVAAVNAAPGLRYDDDIVPLEDVRGLANFKAFAQALSAGREVPDIVVRLDEIEKMFAGSSSDSSGVTQNALGAILTWMEENEATGLIALGPPGSGKSMSSLALGGALGVPTVSFDLGAMKSSLVGSTEQNIRASLKTLKGLARRTFFIASCNREVDLPPELRRRFKMGTWFFDLPTAEERESIWELYLGRYELGAAPRPDDDGWTGAEIKAACETAWRLRVTPKEASQWIVPVSTSAAEQIRSLREGAAGRYVSASSPGPYQYTSVKVGKVGKSRRLSLAD